MLQKIVCLFIVTCSIKAATLDRDGKWIFDVMDKYKPEIEGIKISIETLANKTIENEETAIAAMIRLSLIAKESENLLASLNGIVQNTTAEAAQENLDINNCVEEETKSRGVLETYVNNNNEEINKVYLQEFKDVKAVMVLLRNALPGLIGKTEKLLRDCITQNFLPWQNDRLIACITKGIDDVKSEISDTEFSISSIKDYLKNLFDDMEKDIGEMMQNIVQDMIGIIEVFKECIAMKNTDKEPLIA